ncbi:MAG TPA: 16S rRNA (guanine(527)-N(7))-methyltransferase RsmG [Verrucomicrobiae bacterium]|nr:16S rRNA (guanine(527)-N(7))-methyltransferase RsmG [Verrucomicrobiae bacterium]
MGFLLPKREVELYYSLFREHGKQLGLASTASISEKGFEKLFLESLLILKDFSPPQGATVLDLGSGAGFPAICLKIARFDLNFTLLEPNHKKFLFLEKLEKVLGLQGLEVLEMRAEDFAKQGRTFDFVTARAFGPLEKFAKAAYPFMHLNSLAIAIKATDFSREVSALKKFPKVILLGAKEVKFKKAKYQIGLAFLKKA